MSRCAHAQSTYQLQEMPHCKRCKGELIYVAAKYEGKKGFRWEWECTKCSKVYQTNKIRVPEPSEQDKELHERLNGKDKRRNCSRAN